MSHHQALLAFNNGEVCPYLRHRIDFEKAASSCELLRNFIPMSFGAITKRPGLVPVGSEHPVAGLNSKAFRFISSDGSKYIIHFKIEEEGNIIRIIRVDGTVAATLPFFDGFTWPAFSWDTHTLRDLQIENINDIAIFTHPKIHPFRLTRQSDTVWEIDFVPFSKAPTIEENLDENLLLTVASNPIAGTWAEDTIYEPDDVVFSNLAEWLCTFSHSATADLQPGGTGDWRTYWRRKLYKEGDPITITGLDKNAPNAWSILPVTYSENQAVTNDPYYAPLDRIWICVTPHTTTEASSLSDGVWKETYLQPPATDSPLVGDYAFTAAMDKIYQVTVRGFPAPEPGVGIDWEDYWSVVSDYPEVISFYRATGVYKVGDQVTYDGKQYRCIFEHTAVTATTRPSTGSLWEDYWIEVQVFLQTVPVGPIISPGNYWRLSPERDERDFQVELHAITGNDGKFSPWIAVEGPFHIFTYGTWSGTYIIQKSTNNGLTADTIASYQATDDRNVADELIADNPCLIRLGFIAEDGTDASGRQRALLIPELPYVTGEALVTAFVEDGTMTGIARSSMLSGATFRWAKGAFSEEFGFPRAVCRYETRLSFAATARNPVSRWISAVDDLFNFRDGPEDDDALFRTLATGNQSPIRWMASQRRLFLGTSLGEWVTGSETSDQPLTPTNYIAREYTSHGSIAIQPVIAGSSLLFAGRKGARLYDLEYTTETGYEAFDLSRLAEHLTREGILAMGWQQTREPGLWAVRRDGKLLHFAFSKPEKIRAWSRHDTTGGLFRDVIVFPSDEGDDDIFFVIDRGGECFIERFPQHWQEAFETGELEDMTYTDGEEPIISECISLPIDSIADTGTTQKRMKRTHQVDLSLYRSTGGHIYNRSFAAKQPIITDEDNLTDGWVSRTPDAGALDDLQLKIYHADPGPFTLRCAIVRWTLKEA